MLRKALEEIHSIHIINETLIRFHDVPEIERDEKSLIIPEVGTMKLSIRLAEMHSRHFRTLIQYIGVDCKRLQIVHSAILYI